MKNLFQNQLSVSKFLYKKGPDVNRSTDHDVNDTIGDQYEKAKQAAKTTEFLKELKIDLQGQKLPVDIKDGDISRLRLRESVDSSGKLGRVLNHAYESDNQKGVQTEVTLSSGNDVTRITKDKSGQKGETTDHLWLRVNVVNYDKNGGVCYKGTGWMSSEYLRGKIDLPEEKTPPTEHDPVPVPVPELKETKEIPHNEEVEMFEYKPWEKDPMSDLAPWGLSRETDLNAEWNNDNSPVTIPKGTKYTGVVLKVNGKSVTLADTTSNEMSMKDLVAAAKSAGVKIDPSKDNVVLLAEAEVTKGNLTEVHKFKTTIKFVPKVSEGDDSAKPGQKKPESLDLPEGDDSAKPGQKTPESLDFPEGDDSAKPDQKTPKSLDLPEGDDSAKLGQKKPESVDLPEGDDSVKERPDLSLPFEFFKGDDSAVLVQKKNGEYVVILEGDESASGVKKVDLDHFSDLLEGDESIKSILINQDGILEIHIGDTSGRERIETFPIEILEGDEKASSLPGSLEKFEIEIEGGKVGYLRKGPKGELMVMPEGDPRLSETSLVEIADLGIAEGELEYARVIVDGDGNNVLSYILEGDRKAQRIPLANVEDLFEGDPSISNEVLMESIKTLPSIDELVKEIPVDGAIEIEILGGDESAQVRFKKGEKEVTLDVESKNSNEIFSLVDGDESVDLPVDDSSSLVEQLRRLFPGSLSLGDEGEKVDKVSPHSESEASQAGDRLFEQVYDLFSAKGINIAELDANNPFVVGDESISVKKIDGTLLPLCDLDIDTDGFAFALEGKTSIVHNLPEGDVRAKIQDVLNDAFLDGALDTFNLHDYSILAESIQSLNSEHAFVDVKLDVLSHTVFEVGQENGQEKSWVRRVGNVYKVYDENSNALFESPDLRKSILLANSLNFIKGFRKGLEGNKGVGETQNPFEVTDSGLNFDGDETLTTGSGWGAIGVVWAQLNGANDSEVKEPMTLGQKAKELVGFYTDMYEFYGQEGISKEELGSIFNNWNKYFEINEKGVSEEKFEKREIGTPYDVSQETPLESQSVIDRFNKSEKYGELTISQGGSLETGLYTIGFKESGYEVLVDTISNEKGIYEVMGQRVSRFDKAVGLAAGLAFVKKEIALERKGREVYEPSEEDIEDPISPFRYNSEENSLVFAGKAKGITGWYKGYNPKKLIEKRDDIVDCFKAAGISGPALADICNKWWQREGSSMVE